ncbi:MAG: type IV toxin-antitoxin system AbiEi family antitoxin domain-containing protein [Acidobacteriota bacterium]
MKSKAQQLFNLVKKQGVIRPKDLALEGIPQQYLWYFYRQGKLQRVGRGLYLLPTKTITEHHSLAEAAKRVPRGIICLLSALRFYQLTTQSPFEVWLAIDRKAHKPISNDLPLHIVRFSGEVLSAGIAEHTIEGVRVKIYKPAKTVADCFRYRNKIGVDIAVEALRDCLKKRLATIDEIWYYAKICRVARIIQPYLEAIL